MIALSNGNISLNNLSLFDNKNKSKKNTESESRNSTDKVRKRKGTKSNLKYLFNRILLIC